MQRHLHGIFIMAVATLSTVAGFCPAARASVLCKSSRGNLLVRDVCRPREETLTAQNVDDLGLRGPAGPVGPAGPPGGGLHVVDADGSDVGVVTSLRTYYGQSASILREMTLPDRTSPEFVLFSVTPTGLSTSSYGCGSYYGTFFSQPDCSGARYLQCDYGSCSSAEGAFLFTSLTPGDDGVACYARGGSEFQRGDFYREIRSFGASSAAVAQDCSNRGGSLVGPVEPCFSGSTTFCAQCCALDRNVGVSPLRSVDLSNVGTPPFRLAR